MEKQSSVSPGPNQEKINQSLQHTKGNKAIRIFFIVIGVFLLMYFLSKIPVSQDGTAPAESENSIKSFDHTISNLLVAGKWNEVIKSLKSVPKSGEYFEYAQEKLKRLIKGHNLFKNARGKWKCEVDGEELGDCLDLSGNTIGYSSKFSGNTWYVNYKTGKGWEIDKRFIDYLDNGHLLLAGFYDGKFEDIFEIWQ